MATITKAMVNWTINKIAVNTSLKCSPSNYNHFASRNVKYIVMHYTGNEKDIAKSNATYFKNGSRGASAHFFVDDSNIYQSVELRDTAWHCGCKQGYKTACRNSNSIGIEMCCSAGNYKISAKTKKNAAYLCAEICKLVGIQYNQVDKYVLRHYDVVKSNKRCPAQFVDSSKEWKEFKTWVSNILRYGSITKAAASAVNTATTGSTKPPTAAKPVLRTGSFGTQVLYLQKDLNFLGFCGKDKKPLSEDKDFGSNTAYALGKFQEKYKLEVDQVYGNMSYATMKAKLK